jgi:hypothetical protein
MFIPLLTGKFVMFAVLCVRTSEVELTIASAVTTGTSVEFKVVLNGMSMDVGLTVATIIAGITLTEAVVL